MRVHYFILFARLIDEHIVALVLLKQIPGIYESVWKFEKNQT